MEPTQGNATATATATAAPAAATAATSTPATPSVPTSVTQPDGQQGSGALNPQDSVAAMVAAAESKGFGKPEEPVQTKPAAETPAAATSENKPDAPAASETPAAETKPAAEDTPSYSLDQDGFIGAKDLATKIDANPALKAALPEDLRNEIMANSRLAERASKYEEIFASPGEAKIVQQTAQEYASFSEAFSLIQAEPEKGVTALVNKLIEASVLRGEDGQPLKHENGALKTDGSANKFVDTVGRRWLNVNIAKKVAAIQDPDTRENVQAALDLVMESVGLRPSTAGKTNQDPALAAREAELTRQQEAFNKQQETAAQQRRQEYSQALEGDLTSLYDTEVGTLLKHATGLDAFRKEAIEAKLETAIREAIKGNLAYQTRKARLQSQPPTPARRKQEVALAKEFFADNLARIARPIFKAAEIELGKKTAAQAQSQAAREANSRSEVAGGRAAAPTPAVGGAPGSYVEQRATAETAWKAANPGKTPSDSDLNIFMMLNAAKSKGLPVGNAA